MTDEQFAQWGAEESKIRAAEMADVKSKEDLDAVQRACAARRKAVGLTAGQAAKAVRVGQRILNGESLSFALR